MVMSIQSIIISTPKNNAKSLWKDCEAWRQRDFCVHRRLGYLGWTSLGMDFHRTVSRFRRPWLGRQRRPSILLGSTLVPSPARQLLACKENTPGMPCKLNISIPFNSIKFLHSKEKKKYCIPQALQASSLALEECACVSHLRLPHWQPGAGS